MHQSLRKPLIWTGVLVIAMALWAGSIAAANYGIYFGVRGWLNRATTFGQVSSKTPMISIIANPERYDGKRLRMIGYLHLEFEGDMLCPTLEIYGARDAASCIWIEATPQMQRLSDHYIIVEGRFSSSDRGHMGMFSGALQNVTRADRWSSGTP
jgi:hypothetical protein